MNIDALQDRVRASRNIVFLAAQGFLMESGIPISRSPDGLYHMHYAYPPETIISHSFSRPSGGIPD